MKKLLLISALILFTPATANAGIIEFLFPTLKQDNGPDPSETLVAPFAENLEQQENTGLPTNAIPIDKPHRLSADMTDWVAVASIEALNFLDADYQAQLEKNRETFDAFGYQQYTGFLTQKNLMQTLQSGQYKIRTYNENTPLLMNEGAVDGRYRWLFRVPVIVSYLDANADGYDGVTAINHRATLDIQIGRSDSAGNSEGVIIERWSGKIEAMP